MATGYTAEFEKRDLSFSEFVWRCARAMGAFFHMRENGLGDKLTLPVLDTYHRDALRQAEKDLEAFKKLTKSQLKKMMETEQQDAKKYADARLEKTHLLKDRYSRMLAQVKAWTPPSVEHHGLKDFMIEQLESSIKHDCYEDSFCREMKETFQQWQQSKMDAEIYSVEYHAREWEKDQETHKKLVAWIKALQTDVPFPWHDS